MRPIRIRRRAFRSVHHNCLKWFQYDCRNWFPPSVKCIYLCVCECIVTSVQVFLKRSRSQPFRTFRFVSWHPYLLVTQTRMEWPVTTSGIQKANTHELCLGFCCRTLNEIDFPSIVRCKIPACREFYHCLQCNICMRFYRRTSSINSQVNTSSAISVSMYFMYLNGVH